MNIHRRDLRSIGLRNTPQRRDILRVLEASEQALTVDEIWKAMGDGGSGLPTVYRNLERFLREGWVEALLGPDQIVRYTFCHSAEHHHHIQCEKCGRSRELVGCALESLLAQYETQTGYRLTGHQLQLYGLCPDCQGDGR